MLIHKPQNLIKTIFNKKSTQLIPDNVHKFENNACIFINDTEFTYRWTDGGDRKVNK